MRGMDWMDFNRDGEVDEMEEILGMELLCSSREEHEALFGDAGDFGDEEMDDEEWTMTNSIRKIMIFRRVIT